MKPPSVSETIKRPTPLWSPNHSPKEVKSDRTSAPPSPMRSASPTLWGYLWSQPASELMSSYWSLFLSLFIYSSYVVDSINIALLSSLVVTLTAMGIILSASYKYSVLHNRKVLSMHRTTHTPRRVLSRRKSKEHHRLYMRFTVTPPQPLADPSERTICTSVNKDEECCCDTCRINHLLYPNSSVYDLVPTYTIQPRFAEHELSLMSLTEYLGSLTLHGEATAERVILTFLSRIERLSGVVLPISWALPTHLKQTHSFTKQMLQMETFFKASQVLTPALIPALTEATGYMRHTLGYNEPAPYERMAADALGEGPSFQLPNPTYIDDIDLFIEGSAIPKVSSLSKEPLLLAPDILPGLYFGFGDHVPHIAQSEWETNNIVSDILNRLANNTLLMGDYDQTSCRNTDVYAHSDPFEVYLLSNGDPISRVDDFFAALSATGHTITVRVKTYMAQFGLGFCVQREQCEDPKATHHTTSSSEHSEGFTDIPFALFSRTGIRDPEGREAVLPLPHAGIFISCKGPILTFGQEFYISLMGYCGFFPEDCWDKPWNPGRVVREVQDPMQIQDLMASAALAMTCINVYAGERELYLGGYGSIGVCSDTVAWLEHVVFGETSIWPILGTGNGRVDVIHTARDLKSRLLARRARGGTTRTSATAPSQDQMESADQKSPPEHHPINSCGDGIHFDDPSKASEDPVVDGIGLDHTCCACHKRVPVYSRDDLINHMVQDRDLELLDRLIGSMKELPHDVSIAPATFPDTIRRIRASCPHSWRSQADESGADKQSEHTHTHHNDGTAPIALDTDADGSITYPVFATSITGMDIIDKALVAWIAEDS